MRYVDKEGSPITFNEWVELAGSNSYRTIGRTTQGDRLVSTIWLGVEDGYGLIFETMVFKTKVFGGEHYGEPLDERRYRTEQEAQAGHAELVKQWLTPPKCGVVSALALGPSICQRHAGHDGPHVEADTSWMEE